MTMNAKQFEQFRIFHGTSCNGCSDGGAITYFRIGNMQLRLCEECTRHLRNELNQQNPYSKRSKSK